MSQAAYNRYKKDEKDKKKTSSVADENSPFIDDTFNPKYNQQREEILRYLPAEIATNPAILWVKDISTHPFRKILENSGIKSAGEYTERDIPDRKLKALDEIVRSKVDYDAIAPGDTVDFSFTGYDYSPHYANPVGGLSKLMQQMFDTKSSLGVTIGGASGRAWNGGYEINDVYDFNNKVQPSGWSPYAIARRMSSTLGSTEDENIPKFTFKIRR